MSLKGPTEVQRGIGGTFGICRATFSAAADTNGVGVTAVWSVDAGANVGADAGVDLEAGVGTSEGSDVGADDQGPDG